MLDALAAQQRALDAEAGGRDPGDDWRNLADVSDLVRQRNAIYRQNELPAEARSELTIFWALNANSNFAVFWLLLRILNTDGLLDEIRREMSPYVEINTEKDEFGIKEPRLKIDEKGLVTACPLLKAAFIESLRLDAAPWSLKRLKHDVTITTEGAGSGAPSKGDSAPRTYQLHAGNFIEVPLDLHFSNPKYFEDPEVFRPERHIKPSTSTSNPDVSSRVAEWGNVRAFGGGSNMCPGRLYAEKEILACTGGLLALWDFQPADGKEWKIPKHKKATGVNMPTEDVRVRIRRRKFD